MTLEIAALKDKPWLAKDLALSLNISASEVSESLNRSQIINAIKTVANVFGELNEKIVFVGGAVAGLYVDDPGAS